jgi:predicted alpha/beta-fold hydrolase
MGGNLLNLVKRHMNSLLQDPEHRVAKAVPAVLSLVNPTLEQFDDTFTRVAGGSAPTFPFPTAIDYYLWASSHKVVKDIKVPFLAINAADEPVVQDAPMDGADNGLAVMVLTRGGGHLGWFEAGEAYREVNRWYTKPVLEWLQLNGEYVACDGNSRASPLYVNENGFLKEEGGRDELGCKEIEGGGMIDGSGGEGMLQGL